MSASALALHEAGHVIACIAYSIPIIEASLDVDGGRVRFESPADQIEKGRHCAPLGLAYAIVGLAGAIAAGDEMSDKDVKLFNNGLFLASLNEDRENLSQALTHLARALVAEHHQAIQKIAAALDDRLRLSGAEIATLLAPAAQEN